MSWFTKLKEALTVSGVITSILPAPKWYKKAQAVAETAVAAGEEIKDEIKGNGSEPSKEPASG